MSAPSSVTSPSSSSNPILDPSPTVSAATLSTASAVDSSVKRISAPISGFVDYNPKQQYAFNKWLSTIKATFAEFGFNYLHTRPFERKTALWGEGETQKQIFGVTRLSIEEGEEPDTGLAIPYDRTVPFALWVAEHGHETPFPYKRQDVSLSHRGERAQAGRFRAFVQADVDVVGRKLGLGADVECLATLMTGLNRLNLGTPFTLVINHIGIVKAMVKANGFSDEHQPEVFRLIDKL
ncbi:MAG: Histidine--tRNA ligase, partial [Chlamydiae bacterium]|nr:Histidine--tRNA ligase [Chlamydiota bacterium]